MYRCNVVFALLALGVGVFGWAQEKTKIIHAPATETDPASGVGMYRTYCAVCHGLDGKGNGPAVSALRREPPDLTLLSKRSGGEFPMFRVSNIIQADAAIPAHGSREMPMWGDAFRGLNRDELVVKLRVHNLAQYISSIRRP